MAEVHRIESRRKLEDAAGAWIARLEADDVSESDRRCFAEWLAEDRRHRETFEAMRHTWHRLDALGTVVHGVAGEKPQATVERSRRRGIVWAAAATLLLAVGSASWVVLYAPAFVEYETAVGHQLSVSLEDSSTVDLNTDTLITVDFTDDERAIRLVRGEAHFTVAKDAQRPFVVSAGDGIVKAVGTQFNVYLTASREIEVTVTEGIVEVAKADESIGSSAAPASPELPLQAARVSEGQHVRYNGQVGAVAEMPAPEVERRLAWRQGMLSFDGETLEQVVAEVGRYTNIQFIIADPELRELQVGGYFRSNDLTALTELLETAFGVDVKRDGQRIILTRRNP